MGSSLSRRQLLALGTVSFLAPALRFYPSESTLLAGRAAWAAALPALPLMLGYCLFLTRLLALRREGEGLAELTRRLGGGFGPVLLGLAARVERADPAAFAGLDRDFSELLPELELEITVSARLRHTNDRKEM